MKKVDVVLTGVVVAIVNLIIYASLFCGGIYFILWALKHFNIIGS